MDTQGYGGQAIREVALVDTNDPQRARFQLALIGQVENFAEITPRRVRLFGTAGQDIQSIVRITPREAYPFEITSIHSETPGNIRFDMQKKQPAQTVVWELTIHNLKQDAGRYFDTLILETDSELMPAIRIFVFGNISAARRR